jgi:hypothetical protein
VRTLLCILVMTTIAGCNTVRSTGFWYGDHDLALPADAAVRIGGPLTPDEIQQIKRLSRTELARAFSGLRISFTDRRDAFWRVEVLPALKSRGALPNSGQALALGPLGGRAAVSFTALALNAIQLAPPGAPRGVIIDGIGRGIGRSAAHELAHLIVGPAADDRSDEGSYEYRHANRAAQY